MWRVVAITTTGKRRVYFCGEEDGLWLYRELKESDTFVTLELWHNLECHKSIKRKRKRT